MELGATVMYNIKDPVQSVLGVKELGPSIRTLAQTVVHREINKRNLNDIDTEKRAIMVANELKVRGREIQCCMRGTFFCVPSGDSQ